MLLTYSKIRRKSVDFEVLYKLKSSASDIYWSGYTNKPDRKAFSDWYSIQLDRTDRDIFIAKDILSKSSVGYLYLTLVNKSIEISHGVSPDYQKQGIGSSIVNFVVNWSSLKYQKYDIVAWVAEENTPSIQTFMNNGFVLTRENKSMTYNALNKKVILNKYKYLKD